MELTIRSYRGAARLHSVEQACRQCGIHNTLFWDTCRAVAREVRLSRSWCANFGVLSGSEGAARKYCWIVVSIADSFSFWLLFELSHCLFWFPILQTMQPQAGFAFGKHNSFDNPPDVLSKHYKSMVRLFRFQLVKLGLDVAVAWSRNQDMLLFPVSVTCVNKS